MLCLSAITLTRISIPDILKVNEDLSWVIAIQLSVEAIADRRVEQLAIVHIQAESEAQEFYRQLIESINYPREVSFAELTPGLSVHSGAVMVGVCIVVGK